jgi:hypothetical protein
MKMETKMKHDTLFTKDNSGIIILLAALLIMIASMLFSGTPAVAKPGDAPVVTTVKPQHVEVIEVVATRLK